MNKLVTELAESIMPKEIKSATHFAIMLFYTENSMGISNSQNWICTRVQRFSDGNSALNYYANTRCPASQLIEATSEEELNQKIEQMKLNYQDIDWLEKHLYPYL